MTICKRSGLSFEASSERVKQHPQISAWLQTASKEGWYGYCVEAIAQGKRLNLETIEEFKPLIDAAKETQQCLIQDTEAEWKRKLAAVKAAKEERKRINTLLREHGYSWHSSPILDEVQGETGDLEWNLFHGDRYVGTGQSAVAKALKEIETINQNKGVQII